MYFNNYYYTTVFGPLAHSVMDAIVKKNVPSLEGCVLYTTVFPCNKCTQLIIQSGIKEVWYLEREDLSRQNEENPDVKSFAANSWMLKSANRPCKYVCPCKLTCINYIMTGSVWIREGESNSAALFPSCAPGMTCHLYMCIIYRQYRPADCIKLVKQTSRSPSAT